MAVAVRPEGVGYASETEADHFIWWCEQFLRHSVDRFIGRPLVFEGWQRAWLSEVLSWDPNAEAQYWSSCALVVSRKNGKTFMLAALALYRLLEDDGKPEILLAAGSDKQANKLFDAILDFLRQNPDLDERVVRREHIGQIVNPANGGVIYRLTSSGEKLDGFNPSLVIVDELHGFNTPTLRRTWAALRTARGFREKSQMVTISTAGDAASRASSILGRMIDGNEEKGEVERPTAGLTISRNHESRLLVYNYSAPTKDPADVAAMKLANPSSWVEESFLAQQAAADDLTDSEVLQLHGCVWAETETTFVAADVLKDAVVARQAVDGCRGVLSFDGSDRRDETWLVFTTLDGLSEALGRWFKPKGADEDWRVPRQDVHRKVADAFERFTIVEFAYDPPGWHSESDEWTAKYGNVVVAFDTNQPKRMAPACDRTRSALNSRTLVLGGPLAPIVREHFANAVSVETSHGTTVRKDHPDSPRKIDAAVATIIGADRAAWHQLNNIPTGWAAV